MIQVHKQKLSGPLLIDLDFFEDQRGFFVERFNQSKFSDLALPTAFVQDNFSRSKPGVLRGLHFQINPGQGKLVTCLSGEIYDVIVDLRKDSDTFGQHCSFKLRGEKPQWLWVPRGFAHGFCVSGEQIADVLYKVDDYYSPSSEMCILWNDLTLNIHWPIQKPLVSEKDKKGISWLEFQSKTILF